MYFRADSHPEFYRLELAATGAGGGYEAVLPRVSADTKELVYFIEVVDAPFEISITPEYHVPVVGLPSECSGATAPMSDGPAGVPVPEKAESPAFPPGFDAPAVALALETLSVSGESPQDPEQPEPGESKKKKKAILLALGGAAGAAAGIGLLSGGETTSGPTTPPTPGPPPPSPPPPPPVPTPVPVQACFDLPSSAQVAVPIRIDASCSTPRDGIDYEWELGDGRTREGRVINPIFETPGLYTVALMVSRLEATGTIGDRDRLEKTILIIAASAPIPPPTVPPPGPTGPADLVLAKTAQVTSKIVDGVLEFHIAYALQVTNLGPGSAASVDLQDPLASDLTPVSVTTPTGSCTTLGRLVTCDLGTLSPASVVTVDLQVDVRPGVPENTTVSNVATVQSTTADPVGSNNQAQVMTVLTRPSPLTRDRSTTSDAMASLVSTLSSSQDDGSASATIRIGEGSTSVTVNDRTSYPLRFRSASRTVIVEGVLQRGTGELRWRFDFASDPSFRPGSVEVQEGAVLGLESRAVTFRLGGQPGERVRFSYRLSN